MKSKTIIVPACFLVLLIGISDGTVMAREPYWEEYHIKLSGLTERQILILESTVDQLPSLKPGDLKMNKPMYDRLSRFKELFGFPFDGDGLFHWLLSRVRSFSYRNSRTAAYNQHKGHFIVGDTFFDRIDTVERLYTLIHEARHSDDGGYDHVRCPKDFNIVSSRQPDLDLAGERACDNSDQGAYSFQAAFLFELFAYGMFNQSDIGLLYNSSISRVIPP